MRRLLPLYFVAVSLVPTGAALAQDGPRGIVEKAIQAVGGAERLAQAPATRTRIKGKIVSGVDANLIGDQWAQPPDALKTALELEVGGLKMRLTQAVRGDSAWIDEDGRLQEIDAGTLADMKQSAYHNSVTSLLPLLHDKAFTLAPAERGTVDGRATVGVKVSSPGKPDTLLHFDTETGLLLRSEYRAKKEAAGKEITTAYTYGDYREVDLTSADEQTLKAAGIAIDGPGLLAYLRSQAHKETDQEKVKGLIQALGDESFEARQKAAAELVKLGPLAVSQLRKAAEGGDLETAKRARECLQKIEAVKGPEGALAAALRLAALRRPEGVVEVLLALAPSLPDDALGRELRGALALVAQRDGKPDPLVQQALRDTNPARRSAAEAALGRDGGAFVRQPGRRVLVAGLKKPRKVALYQDGKKEMEWEVTEVQLFNKLEDSLFARPR